MEEIGVRDLKIHATEIVRAVRDAGARYTITYRGRPVGVLLPLPRRDVTTESDPWDEFMRLREQVAGGWQSPQSSVELLSEMRR